MIAERLSPVRLGLGIAITSIAPVDSSRAIRLRTVVSVTPIDFAISTLLARPFAHNSRIIWRSVSSTAEISSHLWDCGIRWNSRRFAAAFPVRPCTHHSLRAHAAAAGRADDIKDRTISGTTHRLTAIPALRSRRCLSQANQWGRTKLPGNYVRDFV